MDCFEIVQVLWHYGKDRIDLPPSRLMLVLEFYGLASLSIWQFDLVLVHAGLKNDEIICFILPSSKLLKGGDCFVTYLFNLNSFYFMGEHCKTDK